VIGQTIDHYRILSEIGAGGMGTVYHARDEVLRRDAVKPHSPAQYQRFVTPKSENSSQNDHLNANCITRGPFNALMT
jgi:serine/threonine protein kinase